MTRLTNDMREAIAAAALAHKFGPIKEKLADTEDALAREAYAALIPASELEALKVLPARWFQHKIYVRFNAGGYDVEFYLKGDARLPMPADYFNRLGDLPHGGLCDRVRAHADSTIAYKAARNDARKAVGVLLASATTLKALRAAWPDGETFYKQYEGAVPASTMPAVRVEEVNKMLGLPPE